MTSVLTIQASRVCFELEISGPTAQLVFFTFALLSERCNIVKTIATKIFIRTIFVENFMLNIFANLKFFQKMLISRENRGKVISDSRFDPATKGNRAEDRGFFSGNTWGHAQELPSK